MRAEAKDSQTYYTPERIAAGRENVEKYDWAKAQLRRIMKGERQSYIVGREHTSAADYSKQSDEFMWTLQPTTRIPRVYDHETSALCPVHGMEVRKKRGFHPWLIDPITHPYQVQCLLGGEWYPSNDFLAGDMTSGQYPDDGNGCVVDGKRYFFIREYAHQAYCAVTVPTLRSLSQAYVLTGERTYAHKCAVLLARLASEYPNHDDRKDRLYYATTGGTDPHYKWKKGGMITDLIWETFCLEGVTYSYDAVYDYLGQDPELIAFFKSKGMPIQSADDLRRTIEEKILRAGMVALLNGSIHGNEGFHQATAMACALVMDDYGETHPNSKDMVDYAYHGGGHSAYIMDNGLTRDGGGHESPGYNAIKLDFIRVSRRMEEIRKRHPDQYPADRYPDIFAGPKARALFDHFIDIQMLNWAMPSIGDSGNICPPRREHGSRYSYISDQYVFAFKKYGDPRHARACTNTKGDFVAGELFERYPKAAIEEALKSPASIIEDRSTLVDGYGVGILRSGEGEHRRAVSLNYSSIIGHRQCDNLHLELYAQGASFLPDLGYPFTWDYRWQWDGNLMAHNTVTVNETQTPLRGIGGMGRLMAEADGVHVLTASHDPYPYHEKYAPDLPKGVDLYERTVVLIDASPEQFYVVDLFAVKGGDQHDQSWHGPLTPIKPPALDWKAQPTGTLAGPDVEQFATWPDRWGRKREDFPGYLKDIKRVHLTKPAAWEWDLGLDRQDTLRLHLIPVGGPMEIIQGRGRSPARPSDWGLDYVLARREAKDGGVSRFLTIIEPFQQKPVIRGIALVEVEPAIVLRVEREGESDEIRLHVPDGSSRSTAQRDIRIEVRTDRGQAPVRNIRIGETYLHSTIEALDYDGRTVVLSPDAVMDAALAVGRYVRIFNDHRSAMFRIVGREAADGKLRLTLDKTALLARGPVVGVDERKVTIDALLTFATGVPDDKGSLRDTQLQFKGSWLGEGDRAKMLLGAVRGQQSQLFLMKPVDAKSLETELKDSVVSVWQYGVGDRVDLATIASEGR